MNKSDFTNSGVLNLRNAIVMQAADDYLKCKKVLLANEDRIDITRLQEYDKVNTIRKWFLSKGYKNLEMKTDGQWMIEQLDILAKEQYEEENEKRRVIRMAKGSCQANA